jgi:ribose transport system ATP-binding protein
MCASRLAAITTKLESSYKNSSLSTRVPADAMKRGDSMSELNLGNTAAPSVQVADLSVTFPGVRALSRISMSLVQGEVLAVAGMNGSGKSTLVKVLSGYYTPDPGSRLFVDGVQREFGHENSGSNLGLSFVHQELALQPSLSAAENLALGRGFATGRMGPINWKVEASRAREAMEALGYEIDVRVPVGELTSSERAAVAIARALAPGAEALRGFVLDEPTAAMPASEVNRLLALVKSLKERGMAVLYISHHLDEVLAIATRVLVLRDGKVVLSEEAQALRRTDIVKAMTGSSDMGSRGATASGPAPIADGNPPNQWAMTVSNVSGGDIYELDFRLLPGEVVGFAGVSGSGREDVCPLIIGAAHRTGEIRMADAILPPRRSDLAAKHGIAIVPADRRAHALFPELTVRENLTVGNLKSSIQTFGIRMKEERRETRQWVDRLSVKAASPESKISELSGGNQQKVIIARALRTTPRVLLLDEPTQGVDVHAKEEIYELVRSSAANGIAVVVTSADSEDLVRVCTRVLVLNRGRVVHELTGAELTEQHIDQIVLQDERPPVERTP